METTIKIQPGQISFAPIPQINSQLNWKDRLGAVKVRWGIGRDNYRVNPGLYKVGNPDDRSDVFISANYKLSFDALRKNLAHLDAWILVIDTKGVNVWCAAGKGTFATDNLVKSIKTSALETIVKHRKIIVPQLGATGVAAHLVRERTGFKVIYGPVRAEDIKSFIDAGYKASAEMRKVNFSFVDRAKLIPVDLMYNKYRLLIAALVLFIFSGLDRQGLLFDKMLQTGLIPVINLAGAYLAGIVLAPLLLPYVPVRAFSSKGAFWGIVITLVLRYFYPVLFLQTIAFGFINVSVASFMMMNFTGSSTYTSLSGVQKEMKIAVPLQIALASAGILLFIISKLI
jgi:acetyl-CoA decarbonylase/synthase complex subunit gamma